MHAVASRAPGSLPCTGFRLLDDDAPPVDASADQRFVLESDLLLTGNAVMEGSLTARARARRAGAAPR